MLSFKKSAFLLLGTTSLFAPACLAAKPTQKPLVHTETLSVVDIPYQKVVLPNGLTVIVHEDRKTPVVSFGVWYHVGSADETVGRTGFAHLFEHLMFNGSEHANDDWFRMMNEVGSSEMNGTTGFDRTNYYETVPTGALDRVLWLESDRMANLLPAVDQAKLDEQRKVVQNEKRQRSNTPTGEVPDMMYGSTYPTGHPYSRTPIGSMEDLNAAQLSDVGTFFNKWYRPNNAVIVLSGDISFEEAKKKVGHYFGAIPAGPPLKRSTEVMAKMVEDTRGVIDVPTANSQLVKVWNLPAWSSPDIQLLDLAAQVLSTGENSRLQRRLVRELKVASDVSLQVNAMERGSQLFLSATARSGVSLPQLEAAINEEMAGFLRDGITSAELKRVQFGTYVAAVARQSSTISTASVLADGQMYAGSPDFYRTQQQAIYDATPATVLRAARTWLPGGSFVLEVRALQKFATSATSVDRSVKPAIGPAANFNLPPLQRATLSNGITVALAERHDVPAVSLSMEFNVGDLPDRNPASAGQSFALSMTMSGTKTRSRLQIDEKVKDLGASMNWGVGQEFSSFNMYALKLKLDESLDLYSDILLNPTFPVAEWDRSRDIFIAAYDDNQRTPEGKLAAVLPKMVYGENHPYAVQMTPEIARRVTVDDFQKFYKKWIRPDIATIFIVGDTTLAEMMPKLEQHFRGWKAQDGALAVKPTLAKVVAPTKPRVVLLDQPGAQSSLIVVGHAGPARRDPDFEALSVVNTVMGDDFLSRLNMNLREAKGWSYGMKTKLEEAAQLGLTAAAAGSVQADKTADSLREINRELIDVGTSRPPSPAEITSAKNAMLLGLPAWLQDSSGALFLYRRNFEFGLPENYWNSYVKNINSLTPEQIGAAAKRLYRPSELTWFVVGDLSKIEADVRNLDLGEVYVMDSDGKRLR